MNRKNEITMKQRKEIFARYNAGHDYRDIAVILELDVKVVARFLNSHGYKVGG